jgi:hypothetical protein
MAICQERLEGEEPAMNAASDKNEAIVESEDVEAHLLRGHEDETIVDGLGRRIAPGDDESEADPETPGMRRARR